MLFVFLSVVVWANRANFFSPFDAEHWKDKYEHSQWNLPLSVRAIGDDGLYLYEGYRLTHGGDLTLLNAEVPPLGKYLIGISIALFHNGYIYGLLTNIGILTLIFLLTKKLTDSPFLTWGTTLLLATDPLFSAQYAITMLDNLQSFWLLLFLWFLYAKPYPLLAGIALGFFSETKFPILTLALLPIGAFYLWSVQKNIRPIWHLVTGLILGYILPYVPYFFSGHTLLDWLKIQKWIVSFYLHSGLTPTRGSAFANIFLGVYQNIYSRAWLPSPQWTPVWTLMLGLSLMLLWRKKITPKEYPALMLAALLLAILMFYSVIPFWTRYLVLLLPLWYLGAAITLSHVSVKVQTTIIAVCVAINLFTATPQLFPTPEGTAKLFVYNWENSFFQDMYEDTSFATKRQWDRTTFRAIGLTHVFQGEIEKVYINIAPVSWPRFVSQITIPITVRYTTRHLGEFSVPSVLRLVSEQGKWRVNWTWSDYLPGLSDTTILHTEVVPAKRGSIIGSDKKPLAEDIPSFLVSITPQAVSKDQEEEMFQTLEKLFAKKIQAVYMHQRVFGNSLSDTPIPIGVIPHTVTSEEQAILLAFPGVSLTPHIGRANYGSDFIDIGSIGNSFYFECCSLLYSTTNYDGISGVEKNKNEKLKGINGGSLTLWDKDGNILQTFLYPEKKDGETVQP